jgi:hypothetical protein
VSETQPVWVGALTQIVYDACVAVVLHLRPQSQVLEQEAHTPAALASGGARPSSRDTVEALPGIGLLRREGPLIRVTRRPRFGGREQGDAGEAQVVVEPEAVGTELSPCGPRLSDCAVDWRRAARGHVTAECAAAAPHGCPPLHDSNVHVAWWPATGTD